MITNKKGAEKILSVYWFAILVLVAAGVFAMVYSFNNVPYDVRKIETNLVIDNALDCLIHNGKIDLNRINENFDLEEECHLDFSENREEEIFLEVSVFDFNSGKFLKSVSSGNQNIIPDCNIQEKDKYGKISQCSEKNIYSIDEKNNEYLVKINSGVRKTEQNVR